MKLTKILCLCLVLCLTVASLVACGGGRAMMTLEDKELSVNVYEFLLSRMKGTLAYYGYDVYNDKFWKTVISSDGETYDDYFCATIRREAAHYLIADRLFDEYGLSLTDTDKAEIDELMAACVKRAGSRAALNSELKKFGVNYEMLRDIYLLEKKIEVLRQHLYGKDGELISEEEKDAYYRENYVSFRQIFLASYYYVTDEDRFGDTVYYTDEKHTHIAYDKQNGVTKTDEFGKVITDVLGDVEYFTEDGKIAYDRERGVIGYVTDDNGDKRIEYYPDSEKAKIYDKAQKYAEDCDGNTARFEEYVGLYGEGETSGRFYLYHSEGYYAAQNSAVAYFDDIAELLSDMEVGECRVYESKYGCHVIFKYENEDGAYEDEENGDAFASFTDDLIDRLFDKLCSEYEKDIIMDTAVASEAPKMKEVGANTLY